MGFIELVINVCMKELQMSNFQCNSFLKYVLHELTKFGKIIAEFYKIIVLQSQVFILTHSTAASIVEFEHTIDGWVNISLSHMIAMLGS